MGHRANYVFVKDHQATAYYDQWGALGCVLALADGPAGCRSIAEPAGQTDELMDWAFCEGGFLVDDDERRLIAFGYVDVDPDIYDTMEPDDAERLKAQVEAITSGPEAYLKYIAPRWKGWTLVWDDAGADAFAAHLNRRGITSLKTQPPSAKAPGPRVELTVADSSTKPPAKKRAAKKPAAKKPTAKKPTAKKPTAKKRAPKKRAPKKPATRKAAAKQRAGGRR